MTDTAVRDRAGSGLGRYTFLEYATQAYVALVGVLVVCFHGEKVPAWPWLAAGHALCLGLVHALIRAHGACPGCRWLRLARHLYPVALYAFLYTETGLLNQMFTGRAGPWYADAQFMRLEQRVFGSQPSFWLMESMPWLWLSELLYFAYFSYYLMIIGAGVALYRKDRRQCFHYISVVSWVFYLCYLAYIFLPVIGRPALHEELTGQALPADLMPPGPVAWPAAVQAGPFYQIMALIYRHMETPGAAFPSSHVAVALTTVYFSFLYLRPIRYGHLALALLLSLATVYCRYHYAVDALAGVLTALLLVPAGDWLFRRLAPPEELPPAR